MRARGISRPRSGRRPGQSRRGGGGGGPPGGSVYRLPGGVLGAGRAGSVIGGRLGPGVGAGRLGSRDALWGMAELPAFCSQCVSPA